MSSDLDCLIHHIPKEVLKVVSEDSPSDSVATEALAMWRNVEAAGGRPICLAVNAELFVLDMRTLIRDAAEAV